MVCKQLYDYFVTNKLFSTYQHAYGTCHSTCTALTQMCGNWLTALDNLIVVGVAAFDLGSWSSYWEAEEYGFKPCALEWAKRTQRVFFSGTYSESKDLEYELPQGVVEGSNDLQYVLNKCNSSLLWQTEWYPGMWTQHCVRLDWNKLKLNISKTVSIIFGANYKLAENPILNLQLEGRPKHVKILSLTLHCVGLKR